MLKIFGDNNRSDMSERLIYGECLCAGGFIGAERDAFCNTYLWGRLRSTSRKQKSRREGCGGS